MIQGEGNMAWIWVVALNLVRVIKFGIYLKACLSGFVDGWDMTCKTVTDLSPRSLS